MLSSLPQWGSESELEPMADYIYISNFFSVGTFLNSKYSEMSEEEMQCSAAWDCSGAVGQHQQGCQESS